jgi:hypothetical protein
MDILHCKNEAANWLLMFLLVKCEYWIYDLFGHLLHIYICTKCKDELKKYEK